MASNKNFNFYQPNNSGRSNSDPNRQNQSGGNNQNPASYRANQSSDPYNQNQSYRTNQSSDRSNQNSGSHRRNQSGDRNGNRNNQNSSSYRRNQSGDPNGNRNNQNSGSQRTNYNNNRGFNTSNSNGRGNSSVSAYDATLYNFFDGSKYPPNYGYSDDLITYKLPNGQTKKVSKSVVDIIGIIFNEDEMKGIIREYSIDPSFIIDDNFSSDIILKALKKLSSLALSFANTVNGNTSKGFQISFKRKPDPLADFTRLLQFIQQPVITTTQQIAYYSHGLNDILLMKDAFNIINEHHGDQNFFYKYYKSLQTKIRPVVRNDDEYTKILQYLKNSHEPNNANFNLEIIDVFKISRRGEFRKYDHFKKNFGLPKLLWFGTRSTNYPSILLKGLNIAPQQSPSIGNIFGKGIYFTDCVSKAARNCHATPTKPEGLLLLAEVALGQTLKLTAPEDITFLRNGKNSVKGLGKYSPDSSQHFITHNGVQVPFGKLVQDFSLKTNLNYNEYVVYNPHQILLQYLVRVKFNFT